jgi:hypothetical protein
MVVVGGGLSRRHLLVVLIGEDFIQFLLAEEPLMA